MPPVALQIKLKCLLTRLTETIHGTYKQAVEIYSVHLHCSTPAGEVVRRIHEKLAKIDSASFSFSGGPWYLSE
jgi:hypothetical protein